MLFYLIQLTASLKDLTPNPSPKAEGDLTLTIHGSYFLAGNFLFSSSFKRNHGTVISIIQKNEARF